MGYDVQFIQLELPGKASFPMAADAAKPLPGAAAFEDPAAVRALLLEVEGCRPGPGDAVDYLGRGLNYARFIIKDRAIHVENNCSVPELLNVYGRLAERFPSLLILDLQSRQIHNAASFAEWWSRPL